MKAIIMNNVSQFSWTMKRSFYFEVHDTMENVVQALESLKGDISAGRYPDNISLWPNADGYRFHYELQQWDKNGRLAKTAFGDGQIWQHENGTVVVEGSAEIDPWGFYGAMLASILATFVTAISTKSNIVVWILLLLGVLAFIIFIYTENRNRVSERIAQALSPDSHMA